MRRREHRTKELMPPAHLLRFRVEDWPDPGPPPEWWDVAGYPWRVFKTRLCWVRARQHWAADHAPEAASAMRRGR